MSDPGRGAATQPLLQGQRQEGDGAAAAGRNAAEGQGSVERPLPIFRPGRMMLYATGALLLVVLCTFALTYSYAAGHYFLSTAPPSCRKSAAAVIVSGLRLGEQSDSQRMDGQQLIIWSGKGHREDVMYDDLRAMDLQTGGWHQLYDHTNDAKNNKSDPIARWKAVAAFDEALPGLVLFGGDASLKRLPHKGFLNDMWWLPTNESLPVWWQPIAHSPDNKKHKKPDLPQPRRAHAGTILKVPDAPTQLIIHGGKAPNGEVMSDVWSASLHSSAFSWSCLFMPPGNGVGAGSAYPAPRKGHIAVTIPGPQPLLFVWGGRNDTTYFQDAWVFHSGTRAWSQWASPPGTRAPSQRDHLGAFYFQGEVYIYGGRGGETYLSSKPLKDLWAFNVSTHVWRQITTQGQEPKGRFLYSMAFSPAPIANRLNGSAELLHGDVEADDGNMLIFGGEGRDGCYMNDVWQFSVKSASWRELSTNRPCQKKCRKKGGNEPGEGEQNQSAIMHMSMQEARKVLRLG